jgi:uncharacterized repeat protein (TIGR03803 family)
MATMIKTNQHQSCGWRISVRALSAALLLVGVFGGTPQPMLAAVQADATYKLLYSFKNDQDGNYPQAVVRDAAGNLYGTTASGGPEGFGTVFKLDSAGTETVLYNFTGGMDGRQPFGGVIRDASGSLYGTTYYGGGDECAGYGCGTVFKLDSTGVETVLHRFTAGKDGRNPLGGLLRDSAGNLYGTTYYGGNPNCYQGCGTVFKLDTAGTERVIYRFAGEPDGQWPWARLIRDSAGNLYGTTHQGGAFQLGTVFKIDLAGVETVLYSFAGGTDGSEPEAGLIQDAAGNLYGTTHYGGEHSCNDGCGTVFKLDPAGVETLLYQFTGNPDGGSPISNLVEDAAGNLYGTTLYGGSSGKGIVFKVDTATGAETVLHSFRGQDGAGPQAGLIRDAKGNLYGTTPEGGGNGFGAIFRLSP